MGVEEANPEDPSSAPKAGAGTALLQQSFSPSVSSSLVNGMTTCNGICSLASLGLWCYMIYVGNKYRTGSSGPDVCNSGAKWMLAFGSMTAFVALYNGIANLTGCAKTVVPQEDGSVVMQVNQSAMWPASCVGCFGIVPLIGLIVFAFHGDAAKCNPELYRCAYIYILSVLVIIPLILCGVVLFCCTACCFINAAAASEQPSSFSSFSSRDRASDGASV